MNDILRPTTTADANQKPKVSIGLPVYNGERYLRESIESVLAQTFEDFELIISDNASTDGTWDICREYASRDQRVRIHRHETNCGPMYNFQQVLSLAQAPYFMWHAYDDVLEPEYTHICIAFLQTAPDHVMCCTLNKLFINEEDVGTDGLTWDIRHPDVVSRFRSSLSGRCPVSVYGVFHRPVLERVFPLGVCYPGDHALMSLVVMEGKIRQINQPLRCKREVDNDYVRNGAEVWMPKTFGPHEKRLFPYLSYYRVLCRRIISHTLPFRVKAAVIITLFTHRSFLETIYKSISLLIKRVTRNTPCLFNILYFLRYAPMQRAKRLRVMVVQ